MSSSIGCTYSAITAGLGSLGQSDLNLLAHAIFSLLKHQMQSRSKPWCLVDHHSYRCLATRIGLKVTNLWIPKPHGSRTLKQASKPMVNFKEKGNLFNYASFYLISLHFQSSPAIQGHSSKRDLSNYQAAESFRVGDRKDRTEGTGYVDKGDENETTDSVRSALKS